VVMNTMVTIGIIVLMIHKMIKVTSFVKLIILNSMVFKIVTHSVMNSITHVVN